MNSKTTKRALLAGVLSMLVCVAMLIGTTFAWFTDTASTAVNKIQAGDLHIGLQYATAWDDATGVPTRWENAEGITLNFKTADGRTTDILWEPGCRYVLPELRIVNKGNLALKYNIVISGIAGDAKLNEVIDWTYTQYSLQNGTYEFVRGDILKAGTGISGTMIPNENGDVTDPISISGTMQETAGNDYQGLYIDGISITVYATQFNYEQDSFGNDYDESADMSPDNLDKLIVANMSSPVAKDSDGNVTDTVLSDAPNGEAVDYVNPNFTVAAEIPAEAIDTAVQELKITVTPTSVPSGITVASTQGVMPYEIKVEGIKADNTEPISVKLFIGKGLENVKVYHKTKALGAYGDPGFDAADCFAYDPATGILSISPKSFSPFTVLYDAPAVTVDGVAYYDFANAVKNASEGSTVTFCKNAEGAKFEAAEPTVLKNITFKAASGVTVKGLQLIGTGTSKKLTLDGITFDGINFTDKVVIGQSSGTNGYSQCSDITFANCKFDLSSSTEKYKDAISRYSVKVSGTITDEVEANAYLDGLTVKNCTFENARYAVSGGKARNVTVEGCKFTDLTNVALNFYDVAGNFAVSGNTAYNTAGVLKINTVGNSYSTTDVNSSITIKGNTADNMTCKNGYVYCTSYDNAKASGKSHYTVTGNSCTYTESFDEPLNGFRIDTTYGPSVAEFIANN